MDPNIIIFVVSSTGWCHFFVVSSTAWCYFFAVSSTERSFVCCFNYSMSGYAIVETVKMSVQIDITWIYQACLRMYVFSCNSNHCKRLTGHLDKNHHPDDQPRVPEPTQNLGPVRPLKDGLEQAPRGLLDLELREDSDRETRKDPERTNVYTITVKR